MAVNFTPIEEVLSGVVGIIPDLVDFVVAILPIIIVLIVIGFVATFFSGIVDMVKRLI